MLILLYKLRFVSF